MLPDPTTFLTRLFQALGQDGIDVSALELDHVCYRVATEERYHELKVKLLRNGVLLSEHQISGRPIATFRLNTPFRFRERTIAILELPAPKAGSPYPEGFEHAEFVVHEDLLAFAQRHPHVQWDLSDLGKAINADVRVRYDGFSVKFHRQSLAYVIEHLDPK
jgi:uncharacterized protein